MKAKITFVKERKFYSKKIWTVKKMSFSGKSNAKMFSLKISECLW